MPLSSQFPFPVDLGREKINPFESRRGEETSNDAFRVFIGLFEDSSRAGVLFRLRFYLLQCVGIFEAGKPFAEFEILADTAFIRINQQNPGSRKLYVDPLRVSPIRNETKTASEIHTRPDTEPHGKKKPAVQGLDKKKGPGVAQIDHVTVHVFDDGKFEDAPDA